MNYNLTYLTLHALITHNAGDQRWSTEEEVLAVYKRNSRNEFHEGAFNYAKALCCLRWISVVKVSSLSVLLSESE